MRFSSLRKCSLPGFVYFKRHNYIFEHFLFVVKLASATDEGRLRAARALATSGHEKDLARLKEVEERKSPAFDNLVKFAEYQSENMIIRFADNFHCFLSDILRGCYQRKPELLRSGETIRLDELLEFRSYRDLVKFLVDRKLRELSYGGIDAVQVYFDKALGVAISPNEESQRLLRIIIELRNVNTHNRGRIDRAFLSRVRNAAGFKFHLGSAYTATFDDITKLANNLLAIATSIDQQVSEKFRFVTRRYSTWDNRNPPQQNVATWLE